MPVKSWNVGDVATASDLNIWSVPIAVIKPSSTPRNLTTTVSDDPDLIVPVAASSTYEIHGVVFYKGASTGTGDIKWVFSVPASATGLYAAQHQNISGATAGSFMLGWTDGPGLTTTQANTNGTSAGFELTLVFDGILAVAGTAGNLTFRWAQNTSSGTNTTVIAQSFFRAQRIG